jgi:hypothetical protein
MDAVAGVDRVHPAGHDPPPHQALEEPGERAGVNPGIRARSLADIRG